MKQTLARIVFLAVVAWTIISFLFLGLILYLYSFSYHRRYAALPLEPFGPDFRPSSVNALAIPFPCNSKGAVKERRASSLVKQCRQHADHANGATRILNSVDLKPLRR